MPFKKFLKSSKAQENTTSATNVLASKKRSKISAFNLLKSGHKSLLATNYTSKLNYNELLIAESELGRTLFGPVPAGHQREFFEYKKNVWIWHENWTDSFDQTHETTIRYEVRPDGVYKKPTGGMYEKLAGKELDNFVTAVKSYFELVKKKLYN